MHDIELTLADVIRILYRRKLFLIALTLIFGACVTGWLLTLQPSYQSSSAVAVEDIGNRSGDLIGTVPVDALREIAEAPSTKRLVFEEAKRRQWLAEDAPFVQVLEVLSSQVRDVASGSRGAPGTPIQVLVLSAQMLDAKSSEELANVWAETLLTQVNSMYSKQTQDIIKAAAVYQETAEQRADLADMQLTSMTLRSLYESPEAVVSGLEEQLSALLQRALTVEAEIRDLQDERDVLVPRVSVQTVDGDWFGNVLTDTYLKAPDTVSSLLASLSSPTAQVARLLLWTLEEEEALQGYEFTSGLNAKKKELARVQGQLEGLEQLRVVLADMKRKQAALAAARKDTPQTLVLNKAITDDALWQEHLSGRVVAKQGAPVLRSEELNPAQSELATEAASLDAQIRESEARLREIEQGEAQGRARVLELIAETKAIEERIALRRGLLADKSAYVEAHRKEYYVDRDRLREVDKLLARAEQSLEQISRNRDTVMARARAQRARMEGFRMSIGALKRRAALASDLSTEANKNYVAVAGQPQIVGQTRSPSGAFLLVRAEANPIRLGTSRRKTLMAAMMLCFAVLSAFFVVRDGILKE